MGIAPVPFALVFTAAVLAVHALRELPALPLLVALTLPALLPWRGRAPWSAAALGVLLTVWRAQGLLEQRWPASRHGEDLALEGWVASLPEREGPAQRFRFEPADAGAPAAIRAGWYRSTQSVRAGECWRLTLRLRAPHGSLNPGGFDYEGWLFRQGITATATVRAGERCTRPPRRLPALRQQVADAVREALPGRAAAGLLAALTVGDDSGIAAADWELFRRTGTTHLVAISGFNIAIVAGVAYVLCRWLWSVWPRLCLLLPAPRAGLLGSAVIAGAYALLAGFEAPVQRAVVMLWLVLAAVWAHRASRPSRVLALAWLAALVPDPLAIATPGLWLSFGAVAAIFYASLGRLRPPGPWHALVLLQLLIAVALAPLSLFFFQGGSWLGPWVNLFAVPLFAVLTPWALGALLLYLAWPEAGTPLLQGCALALDLFRDGLAWVARAPAPWLPASPPPASLMLALAGVGLLFAPRGLPLRPLGVLSLLPMLVTPVAAPRGGFEVTALDVGQGLAVVVRTARHTLLYDAGPAFAEGFDAGASVVAPFLLRAGVRELDALLLSHGDNDHAGGVNAVRSRLRVRREIGTPEGERCRAGMSWEWDGVRFEILHPDAVRWNGNDASCVLRVAGAFTLLLPGDIEVDAERALVRGGLGGADVVVSPHHGSRSSSTADFVAAVRPAMVIHSAGWRNPFRHPRPEVVARYASVGAIQAQTGAGGAISLWRDPVTGRIEVKQDRVVAARWWNEPAGP